MDPRQQVEKFKKNIDLIKGEISKVIVGHSRVIDQLLIAILSGGHALLEGVPGIGKTLLVRTLSQCLELKFSRIQFTPDLMPADIIGTNIIIEDEGVRRFEFQKGPIFGNIILGDEINRATPKTQSALLEAMQERSVTVYGKRYPLEEPFFVLATQNPIEMEGTYPLPEAQLDRFFFKIDLTSSNLSELIEIANRTTGTKEPMVNVVCDGKELMQMRTLAREVPIATHVAEYAARVVLATHPELPEGLSVAKKYLRYGSSPRGVQSLILGGKILALMKGRFNVSFQDIKDIALPALRHRLILNYEAQAEGINPDTIITQILQRLPESRG
jgi:MoxR-like ATPase